MFLEGLLWMSGPAEHVEEGAFQMGPSLDYQILSRDLPDGHVLVGKYRGGQIGQIFLSVNGELKEIDEKGLAIAAGGASEEVSNSRIIPAPNSFF